MNSTSVELDENSHSSSSSNDNSNNVNINEVAALKYACDTDWKKNTFIYKIKSTDWIFLLCWCVCWWKKSDIRKIVIVLFFSFQIEIIALCPIIVDAYVSINADKTYIWMWPLANCYIHVQENVKMSLTHWYQTSEQLSLRLQLELYDNYFISNRISTCNTNNVQ